MQKKIKRMCSQCGVTKRTTLDITEAKVYYCEDCQKEAGLPVLQGGIRKGMRIVFIVALISFIIGFVVCYLMRGLLS
jgi:hypothetical protein|tara:strand:- start:249 stop:479 length:231 start_codon:yes stop_codon:yes gene_type:complete